MGDLVLILITAYFAYRCGHARAHYEVAQECKKLGKFYVGKEVFECVQVTYAYPDPAPSAATLEGVGSPAATPDASGQ
jgi:hypothetical protein